MVLPLSQAGALCGGLPFSSYFLTPIQRIPRYKLLLQGAYIHTVPIRSNSPCVCACVGACTYVCVCAHAGMCVHMSVCVWVQPHIRKCVVSICTNGSGSVSALELAGSMPLWAGHSVGRACIQPGHDLLKWSMLAANLTWLLVFVSMGSIKLWAAKCGFWFRACSACNAS